jgi:signal transduction histidine kinase
MYLLSIEIATQIKDDYTLLSVRDNGIGIDLETYGSKLFPHFTGSTLKIQQEQVWVYISSKI